MVGESRIASSVSASAQAFRERAEHGRRSRPVSERGEQMLGERMVDDRDGHRLHPIPACSGAPGRPRPCGRGGRPAQPSPGSGCHRHDALQDGRLMRELFGPSWYIYGGDDPA